MQNIFNFDCSHRTHNNSSIYKNKQPSKQTHPHTHLCIQTDIKAYVFLLFEMARTYFEFHFFFGSSILIYTCSNQCYQVFRTEREKIKNEILCSKSQYKYDLIFKQKKINSRLSMSAVSGFFISLAFHFRLLWKYQIKYLHLVLFCIYFYISTRTVTHS